MYSLLHSFFFSKDNKINEVFCNDSPFKIIFSKNNIEKVLNIDKKKKFDSKHYVIYYHIPNNLISLDKFTLDLIGVSNGRRHLNIFEFDKNKNSNIIYHNNFVKNVTNFVDYNKSHGLITLKEYYFIIENCKITLRWDKSGLKNIGIHIT